MRNAYRPWLAAVLALVFAGLGHAYLRRWARALLWLGTIIGGNVALTMIYGPGSSEAVPGLSIDMMVPPEEVLVPMMLVLLLSAVDAFLVGREQVQQKQREEAAAAYAERANATDGPATDGPRGEGAPGGAGGILDTNGDPEGEHEEAETVSCPHCGKDADPDLSFCHWCTEPLPWAESDEG